MQVGQWGSFVRTRNVSSASAIIDLDVWIVNKSSKEQPVELVTDVFVVDEGGKAYGKKVASFGRATANVGAGKKWKSTNSLTLSNPLLWGPPPTQKPQLYKAVTRVYAGGKPVDVYETPFGIRSLVFDPQHGLLVNGQAVRIQGVNQHHDLGALGAAFNTRAAERQLELLAEMGCNAIRLAHNPPAAELLDLTDRMGFLVIDEVFDCWERGKTPLDFHLIFGDWGRRIRGRLYGVTVTILRSLPGVLAMR
ncbi:glycoside hydrolase family 2 TIM barrel-domain containing protein [Paraflavitalea speifideaquila]|uniref:glycoside hydrolase family 2 TIM barrel-domain containing protein n=1 Tax=Paraflavitalea speifideaquila TaxID=3076558 RepID=UPI0028EB405E|nr:glycoside hydrolase family 2 TIM barrel-domain containing protein [Paraflavitalea speifideiaquila]